MPILNEIIYEERFFNDNIYEDSGLSFYYRTRFIPMVSQREFDRISNYLSNPATKFRNIKNYKVYKTNKKIKLKSKINEKKDSFFDTLFSRMSIRKFINESMSFDKFSYIISSSYGVNGKYLEVGKNERLLLRTVPSAGGLYPIEMYVAIFNIEGLEPGIYHYNPIENNLELIKSGNFSNEIIKLYQGLEDLKDSSAVILLTAVYNRTVMKYGERGWRFIFLDAGHLMQNIYLTSTNLKVGVYALGGGYDSAINRFLGINELNEVYVYGAAIGNISHD